MNVNLNLTGLAGALRNLLGLAAVVYASIPAASLPASVRAPLILVGGAILGVQHYLDGAPVPNAIAISHTIDSSSSSGKATEAPTP